MPAYHTDHIAANWIYDLDGKLIFAAATSPKNIVDHMAVSCCMIIVAAPPYDLFDAWSGYKYASQVDVPRATAPELNREQKDLRLVITQAGRVFLNQKELSSVEELEQSLDGSNGANAVPALY